MLNLNNIHQFFIIIIFFYNVVQILIILFNTFVNSFQLYIFQNNYFLIEIGTFIPIVLNHIF